MRKRFGVLLSVVFIMALLAPIYVQTLLSKFADAQLLTSSLVDPPISEFTVPLYVDGFDNTKLNWTRVGASPYLNGSDYPNSYISGTADGEEIGDFSFQDVASYDGGKIFIQIYGYSRGPGDDQVEIWLYNGTSYYKIGTTIGLTERMGWATSDDVSPYLTGVAQINAAKVYLVKRPVGDTPDRMEIDAMRLVPEQQILESHPSNYSTDLTVADPGNALDGDGATWASFVYSSASGSFSLYNFTSPVQYPSLNTAPLPSITSVDFSMRYNTSLNTGNLDDNYRIVYYVGSSGPVTLVGNRTDNATCLYVDSLDDTLPGWHRVGDLPYLNATDSSYIQSHITVSPNANGMYMAWDGTYEDWDDVTPDGDATYISASAPNLNESSQLQDPTAQPWSIGKVRLVIVGRQTGDERVEPMLVIGGKGYNGSLIDPMPTYSWYSSEWLANPATASAWTWNDINNLEAGVRSKQSGASWTGEIRITQMFVEVIVAGEETIGVFSFEDLLSEYEGGEVFVEINATQLVPWGDTADTVELYLYNQTGGPFLAYTFEPKNGTWGWVTSYDVSSVFDTKALINDAKAYLLKNTEGAAAQIVYVDSMRIKIHNPGYVHEPATLTWTDMPEPRDGVWNWTDVNDIRFVVEAKAASGTTDHGCRFHEFEAWVTVASPRAKLHVERVIDDSLVPYPPVTIKPNADRAKMWNIYPTTPTTHFDKVYDWPTHDSDATYVYTNLANRKESFALEDPAAQAWEISSVRIVAYARQTTGNEKLFGYLRISSIDYSSTASYIPTTEYARYTFDWGLNPYTAAPWQWGEMAALVAGVISFANGPWSGELRVTQLYVEIVGSPTFDADVWVEGAVDLWGFSLIVSYDTGVLSAVGVGNYTPFSKALPSSINDVAGYAAFGYTMPAGSEFGTSGNVTCGKVSFVPDSEGFSTLDLSNTKLSNSKAAVIPHSVVNSMFENQVGAAPVEDVAVRTVTPSASVAYQGYPRNVSVDVKNEGTVSATFDVTAFYNGSSMGTQTVTSLAPGVNTTLTFTWNTAGVPYGNYTISAFATKLTYEVDTGDNSETAPDTVTLTIPGDVNGDKIVDVFDILKIKYHRSGPPPGPGGYDRNVDINDDGFIDVFDILIAKAHLGEAWG